MDPRDLPLPYRRQVEEQLAKKYHGQNTIEKSAVVVAAVPEPNVEPMKTRSEIHSDAQKARYVADPSLKTKVGAHLPKDGSTFRGKKHTDEAKKKMSVFWKKWHQENPHPKGMKGKHHSPEFIERIRQRHVGVKIPPERVIAGLKTKVERYGSLAPNRVHTTWKAGWRLVGDRKIYFRSRWEANYGRYLEFLKKAGEVVFWAHEPTTFWFTDFGIKRGNVSYLPDFHVLYSDGRIEYHEVKGWMDASSKTKIKRFRKYYPEHVLVVLDSAWFKSNARKLSGLIKEWE